MKRLIGTLALVGAALAASPAQAQEIQIRGPLAGARSVARLVRYREGRIAVTPLFGITLQDTFSRDLFFGARAEYHFTDWLGVGVMGAVAPVHLDTSLTDQVKANSVPSNPAQVPRAANFPTQVGRRNWMADLHLTFIPLRGKFALFQSLVADVDFFLFAGAAFVGIEERADTCLTSDGVAAGSSCQTGSPENRNRSQTARSSRVAIAPTFGAGLNFYLNRFISINLEYRATPFSWNTSGTDENSAASRCGLAGNEVCSGFSDYASTYFARTPSDRRTIIDANDRSLSFNQMFTIGVSIYLPTSPRIGP